jgi:hypothetical protein
MRNPMTCPYLKEVVMLYCDACPFKKMVPLDHLVSVSPCLSQDFQSCRHLIEAVATAASAAAAGTAADKEHSDARPGPFTRSKEVNPS